MKDFKSNDARVVNELMLIFNLTVPYDFYEPSLTLALKLDHLGIMPDNSSGLVIMDFVRIQHTLLLVIITCIYP